MKEITKIIKENKITESVQEINTLRTIQND